MGQVLQVVRCPKDAASLLPLTLLGSTAGWHSSVCWWKGEQRSKSVWNTNEGSEVAGLGRWETAEEAKVPIYKGRTMCKHMLRARMAAEWECDSML